MQYDGVINKPALDEALEHYGVKGMKWRKRKAKNLVDKGYPSAESNKSYNLNLKTMQLTDDHYAKANKATDKSKPLTRAEKLRKKKKNSLTGKWTTRELKRALKTRKSINGDLKSSNQAYEQLVNRQKKKK